MAINSVQSQSKVKPADIPLEKLSTSKNLSEEQKTNEAARQFEALLVRQILTQAQKPAFPSKFTNSGVSNSVYQDMMTNELADKISSSHSLGLAQELGSQLKRQAHPNSAALAHHAPAKSSAHFQSKKIIDHAAPGHPTKSPRL